MHWVLERAGKIVLIVWGLFLVPVIVEVLKNWVKKWSGYDDPSGALGAAINTVGNLANLWWLQWIVVFLSGLLLGLWIEKIAKQFQAADKNKSMVLGIHMQRMGDRVVENTQRSLNSWPANLGIPRAELISLFIRIEQAGLWFPSNRIFEIERGGAFLANYFVNVGTLLADGHFKQAKQMADSAKTQLETEKALS